MGMDRSAVTEKILDQLQKIVRSESVETVRVFHGFSDINPLERNEAFREYAKESVPWAVWKTDGITGLVKIAFFYWAERFSAHREYFVWKEWILIYEIGGDWIAAREKKSVLLQDLFQAFCGSGEGRFPLEGYDVPHNTIHAHLVTLAQAYQLLLDVDVQFFQLLVDRLAKGYARKHGMRKFVLNEGKALLLECVDEMDDRCISVPEWIDRFVRDFELYRREVARSSSESIMEPSTSGLQQWAGKRKRSEDDVINTETSPVDDEPFSCSPVDIAIKSKPISDSDSPVEIVIKTEHPSIPENTVDIVIKSEPSSDNVIETETSEEPIPQAMNSEELPEKPTAEETETNRKLSLLYAVMNFKNITFSSASRFFPESGDVIVKFQTTPSRVYFCENGGRRHVLEQ
ncbi:hypothetical protein AVEN_181777-1 [Araneus ventricosus]|uniref:Uncharacterized protein n=1 Tax=Araneus ventricosus TaxID=182803 RepID=A0A4Y2T767_ARAVE|nr:hypothetical protein AVEN_86463-1 [Araneus ventricosus]GBO38303.1 hypothetical protein AVEN_181777-1 [Araneus ventricosus]